MAVTLTPHWIVTVVIQPPPSWVVPLIIRESVETVLPVMMAIQPPAYLEVTSLPPRNVIFVIPPRAGHRSITVMQAIATIRVITDRIYPVLLATATMMKTFPIAGQTMRVAALAVMLEIMSQTATILHFHRIEIVAGRVVIGSVIVISIKLFRLSSWPHNDPATS